MNNDFTIDRLKNELDIIHSFFKVQYQKYDPTAYPELQSYQQTERVDNSPSYKLSGRVGGRFIHSVDIISEVHLFNIPGYKKEFTAMLINASNPKPLENLLNDVREKAKATVNYYDEYLTDKTSLVVEFTEKKIQLDKSPRKEYFEHMEFHRALMTVFNPPEPCINTIYLGADIQNRPKMIGENDYKFIGTFTNYRLAGICQRVVDFVNKLTPGNEITAPKPETPATPQQALDSQDQTCPLTPRRLALYIYFLMEANIMPYPQLGKKQETLKDIAIKYSVQPDTFLQKFGKITHNKNGKSYREKGTQYNINDLKAVCGMLVNENAALTHANETLRFAKINLP